MDAREFTDVNLEQPIKQGIVLRRVNDTVYTNVPHLVVHHSPDGFEFGYGGSGPADLALNLCEEILDLQGYEGERMKCFDGKCFNLAWRIHQEAKRLFIATIDHDAGGTIEYETIAAWIARKVQEDSSADGTD